MGITANPQKLQVDTAQIRNQTVVPAALRIRIRSHAIGNMDMVGSNIDVVEEVLMHEVVIALRIVADSPRYSSRFTEVASAKSRSPFSYQRINWR